MISVTRAMKPFKKIIILTAVSKNIPVLNTLFVHSVGIPKSLSPEQLLPPYDILTIGSAKIITINPSVAVMNIRFPFWKPSSSQPANIIT
jgi:hypothetical protein